MRTDPIALLRAALTAVDELTRERDEARAQVARLQDVLDCERGVRAPEGWVWDEEDGYWTSCAPGMEEAPSGWLWDEESRSWYFLPGLGRHMVIKYADHWSVFGSPQVHTYTYALEAIEAADLAAKGGA